MSRPKHSSKRLPPVVKVVDLFCGAGGLAYGLKSAGMQIAAGVDLDPACKFPFETNCGGTFAQKSVDAVTATEVATWFEGADYRVLAGCAPCQPFSTYSQSRKTEDERWTLLRAFLDLAKKTLPEIVTMENVSGLSSSPIWPEFVNGLRAHGYEADWAELRCNEFGVPQTRKRLVLLASRLGPIQAPVPDKSRKTVSVRDAIAALPPISAGQRDVTDRLHISSRLSKTNLQRIKASTPGGTWRDWPKELRAKCHVRETGGTYPSVYGRMGWDAPSPTITTQCFGYGNGRFGHPEQDRAISLREAAVLQSFPVNYRFVADQEATSFATLSRLIGNAVPPKLAEAIGHAILTHIDSLREAT